MFRLKDCTPKRLDPVQISELYKTKSSCEIAKILGCSSQSILAHLRKLGITRTKSEATRKAYSNRPEKHGVYMDRDGYVWIRMRSHPFCNSNGRVPEHHLVAEKALGRYLRPGEIVHHWDNNHSNNVNSNLLISLNDYHIFIHWKMEKAGLFPKRQAGKGKNGD